MPPTRTRGDAATRAAMLLLSCGMPAAARAQLTVVDVSPDANSLDASAAAVVRVTFDRTVQRASVTPASFWGFARWSGTVGGEFSFSNGDRTVTLTPNRRFSAGESVMLILSHDLRGTDGSSLRAGGYSWQFWTRARRGRLDWRQIDSMTTRTLPSQTTRSYGAVATDLNGDGWLDLTVVNEDTADLRVFLNRAEGSGLFHPFILPTFPVNDRASPNEPSDFNRDGKADICVANINTASVSVLLGNGDGTFAPHQEITVGSAPRGVCVLDADGDGDVDIVNTNYNSSNCSLLRNNGSGVFGAPAFFEGGGAGEWALSAADMTGDGLLDLVIGAHGGQRTLVTRNNGNGTFTNVASVSCGGQVWMNAVADVNRDGRCDVASANSTTNNAAIQLGNGAGGVGPATTYSMDAFPLATDLGDVNGDGYLDWINSSYSGDWTLFLNDGDGTFTFSREFPSPQAASCAVPLDFDNDRDLDLALIDELADVVILYKNSGTMPVGDANCDGSINAFDIQPFVTALSDPAGYEGAYPDCDLGSADINGDGSVNAFDIQGFVELLGG